MTEEDHNDKQEDSSLGSDESINFDLFCETVNCDSDLMADLMKLAKYDIKTSFNHVLSSDELERYHLKQRKLLYSIRKQLVSMYLQTKNNPTGE